MHIFRLVIVLSTAPLFLFARFAPSQTPAAALSAGQSPNLTTKRRPTNDAQVLYSQGRLQVIADDSSLNLTLLQIARDMGIKVSGTAPEERIFGTYGPSTPADLFRILLQGTGTNMLITQGSANAPAELILTPQNGPATLSSVHPATINQPPSSVASEAQLQPVPVANTSPTSHSNGQAEPDSNTAEPPLAPVPLAPAERALLVDRLQQQQRQTAVH